MQHTVLNSGKASLAGCLDVNLGQRTLQRPRRELQLIRLFCLAAGRLAACLAGVSDQGHTVSETRFEVLLHGPWRSFRLIRSCTFGHNSTRIPGALTKASMIHESRRHRHPYRRAVRLDSRIHGTDAQIGCGAVYCNSRWCMKSR